MVRRIQNPVEHLKWSFQPLTVFEKTLVLDIKLGSEYASFCNFEYPSPLNRKSSYQGVRFGHDDLSKGAIPS